VSVKTIKRKPFLKEKKIIETGRQNTVVEG